jgi:hypothetical protein
MHTVRTHEKGKPFTHTTPEGCQTKSKWQKQGFILKPDAKPAAWVLMGDNYHEFAVFAPDQVIKGEYPMKREKPVTAKMLDDLFEQYLKIVNRSDLYLIQENGHYWVDTWDSQKDQFKTEFELSGHYDERSGRLTTRGSRRDAYESLKRAIEKEEQKKP